MENKKEEILKGLNEAQRQAVEAIEGPILIVAGAGSGKTRVLTSRVAYMLASGIAPSRILALTFTKKAATEMKERISLLVGPGNARRVVMGTFHAVFVRFLREYADSLGYPPLFTIYDTSDSVSAMKACIKELSLDEKVYKPKEVLSRISTAKNSLVTPSSYVNSQDLMEADRRSGRSRIADLYARYQQRLKNAGVMDFDDILVNMNILLRDNAEALQSLRERFSYIMVDEYQDTNFAQYNIIRKLTGENHNICVVGDDSQSIYAFRGARIQNIINFRKDYPDCRVIMLEKNYRSTQVIVNAANSVIAHNTNRLPKNCYSEGAQGEKIRVITCDTETDEAAQIGSIISRGRVSGNAHYKDFAILYRLNSQSRAIEETLRRKNIPYVVFSGNSFFERAEVKNMMAYFKLAVNVNDDESFKRVVNTPARGIGDTSVAALTTAANAHRTSLFKAIYLDDLETFGLKSAAQAKLKAFGELINGFALKAQNEDAYQCAMAIGTDSGYYQSLKLDTSPEGKSRVDNVEELISSVASYVQDRQEEAARNEEQASEIYLRDYLENVSLMSNADTDQGEDPDKVSLMTVHAAKGLEFPYVIVAGMEKNIFPSMIAQTPGEIEEERRLFYVALTRAEKSVVLTHCDSRMRNGKTENNPLSPFVKEIDPQYLAAPLTERPRFGSSYGRSGEVQYQPRRPMPQRPSVPSPAPARRPTPAPAGPVIDFTPDDMSAFRAGQLIEHNRFGKGRILTLSGEIPEVRAEVDFYEYGKKTLLLKYAKMRVLKEK